MLAYPRPMEQFLAPLDRSWHAYFCSESTTLNSFLFPTVRLDRREVPALASAVVRDAVRVELQLANITWLELTVPRPNVYRRCTPILCASFFRTDAELLSRIAQSYWHT
ncbi:uncharacterized protein PV09_01655 [Verruconis gallopava]|uniref:Uncharacterized protein n=1 Tax=Verruconis gallopava TaxID=253628 RepID=A0A0D2AML1_9PEZI|nr:uncharacterized protein PV09_01655 [Verruconis gallopava]KIW07725.1 hypothetical protein PV09_01655 [Verruconis gallopava]